MALGALRVPSMTIFAKRNEEISGDLFCALLSTTRDIVASENSKNGDLGEFTVHFRYFILSFDFHYLHF
jgi:hypothetical protein